MVLCTLVVCSLKYLNSKITYSFRKIGQNLIKMQNDMQMLIVLINDDFSVLYQFIMNNMLFVVFKISQELVLLKKSIIRRFIYEID